MGNVYAGMTSYCGCSLTVYFNLNELLLNENQNDGCLYTLPNLVIEKFSETKREQRTEIPSLSLPISLLIFLKFFLSLKWSFRGSPPSEAVRKGYSELRNFSEEKSFHNFVCAGKRYFKFCNYEDNILESRV